MLLNGAFCCLQAGAIMLDSGSPSSNSSHATSDPNSGAAHAPVLATAAKTEPKSFEDTWKKNVVDGKMVCTSYSI